MASSRGADYCAVQDPALAIATEWPNTTFKLRYERAGWWDDVQNFWDEFTAGRGELVSDAIGKIALQKVAGNMNTDVKRDAVGL